MRRPNFLGLVVATLFLAAAASPSLLPRFWLFQALIAGLVTATGYGIGTFLSYLWRRLPIRELPSRLRGLAWQALAIVSPASVLTMWLLGTHWQSELHAISGMSDPSPWGYAAALLIGIALAAGLVLIGRAIMYLNRRLGSTLARWLPRPLASLIGGILVFLLLVGLWDGVVSRAFFSAADETFRLSDALIDENSFQPASPYLSGSPDSLVLWNDLGSKGRAFVSEGPTVDDIESFSGKPALEPIRVYAGLSSEDDLRARAELVVAELERAGGFERSVLCVVTTTGTGWVDPHAVAALEYLWNGDTAVAALQYSYLPSWLSLLVDSARAREAGRVFFEVVSARWEELEPAERPLLLVFGESLGADGSEAAFSGDADIRRRTDGVLWVGPPNFSELWTTFTENRDPASPERLPIFEGGTTVRFAADPGDIDAADPEWTRPRVLYLQHANDPVVWWSARLILRQPDWMREPPGPGVMPEVRWYPLVTFWQLSADLAYAHLAPPGHGHNYGGLVADAWAAISPPPDWTQGDTDRLHDLINSEAEAALAEDG